MHLSFLVPKPSHLTDCLKPRLLFQILRPYKQQIARAEGMFQAHSPCIALSKGKQSRLLLPGVQKLFACMRVCVWGGGG